MLGTNDFRLRFPLPTGPGRTDVIEGDRTAAETDECEGQRRQAQRKFISPIARETVLKMDLGDRDAHVDTNSQGGNAGKQADQDQQAANELGEGGQIRRPARQSEALDKLHVVMKSSENFVVSVDGKDGADGEAHHQKGKRLQSIEVAQ